MAGIFSDITKTIGNTPLVRIDNLTNVLEMLADDSAECILQWIFETYGNRVAIASSFGAEDVVLIDMAVKINPAARIFTLDTGRLSQETYQLMDEIRERYGILIEVCFPDRTGIRELIEGNGFDLFYKGVEQRKRCCAVRKIEPLREKLKELDAWVCGLRKEQSITRASVEKIEIDTSHGNVIKVNPLADWSEKAIWDYIRENNVPYNKLHDRGYPSIGCSPCTRAVRVVEDVRAGRWWWELPEQKECGLHGDARKNDTAR